MVILTKPERTLSGKILLPASEDVSNQLLCLSFLCPAGLQLRSLSTSSETTFLARALERIKQHQKSKDKEALQVDAGDAAGILYFLITCLCMSRGNYILNGSEMMQQQPVGVLVEALKSLGGKISYLNKKGLLPLKIEHQTLQSWDLNVDASVDPKTISALLLIAPFLNEGMVVHLKNYGNSIPLVATTIKILEKAGIPSVWNGNTIHVFNKPITRKIFAVEPCWSSAAFWYSMAAITDSTELLLTGLKSRGVQAGAETAKIYEEFGVMTDQLPDCIRLTKVDKKLREFHFDFGHHPELALPIVMLCAATGTVGYFKGLGRLNRSDTTCLGILQDELSMCGFHIRSTEPGDLELKHGRHFSWHKPVIYCGGNHRLALSSAILAMKGTKIRMDEPGESDPAYPGVWDDLRNTGFMFTHPKYKFRTKVS